MTQLCLPHHARTQMRRVAQWSRCRGVVVKVIEEAQVKVELEMFNKSIVNLSNLTSYKSCRRLTVMHDVKLKWFSIKMTTFHATVVVQQLKFARAYTYTSNKQWKNIFKPTLLEFPHIMFSATLTRRCWSQASNNCRVTFLLHAASLATQLCCPF